jgi:hypothetical protein
MNGYNMEILSEGKNLTVLSQKFVPQPAIMPAQEESGAHGRQTKAVETPRRVAGHCYKR